MAEERAAPYVQASLLMNDLSKKSNPLTIYYQYSLRLGSTAPDFEAETTNVSFLFFLI